MPTIFSKWNGKSLKSGNQSRYVQGISSTDLHSGAEDAPQLKDVSKVGQYLETKALPDVQSMPAPALKSDPYTATQRPDISAWRADAAQQPLPNPLSEFGAGSATMKSIRRASTAKPNRRSNEHRALYSSNTVGAQASKPIRQVSLTEVNTAVSQPPSYGYTTYGWDTQMDVTRVTEIVLACGQHIRARGLDSPLIFSSMALDLSSHSITSLLQSLIQSPATFLSIDAKFANAHDLAAVMKWSLARLGRVVPASIPSHDNSRKGNTSLEETILVQQRGFIEWDLYTRWAMQEKSNGYLLDAFGSFLNGLSSSSLALLVAVFSLLSSTTSYSHKNGMTPSRLSRLFGVLIFGLPEDETFEKTYEAFVRASNATEHLLLAYIRDCGTTEAVPTRLADHVKGYPAMVSSDLNRPSRSVGGVPMTHVNRTVRLYSLDLIQTACEMDVADNSIEWKACCSTSDSIGKDPQLSDRFRKLINLRGGKKQGRGQKEPKENGEMEAYGSLVDKKWGDFMNEGFSAPDQSKLAFDLQESERKARKQRPDSVQWSTFEQSGFVLKDDGLASVLSFDDGLQDGLERWPAERAELMEKLRKTNKMMPAFPYDTTPYIVSSPTLDNSPIGQWVSKPVSRIDEVFAEVYADILLGNGWSNRDEQTHRNANFVIVQFKSRPTPSTVGSQGAGSSRQTRGYIAEPDDRINAAWFVVEEIVPAQYRSEMEASGRAKWRSIPSLRKLNIFKRRKVDSNVKTTQSHFPSSSFDELFRPGLGGITKRVQLSKDPASATHLSRKDSGSTIRQRTIADADSDTGAGAGRERGSRLLTTISTIRNNSTFRSKSMKFPKKPEDDEESPPAPPPKQQTLTSSPSFGSDDFETRSLHDPESDAFAQDRSGKHSILKGSRNGKRMSKDDSWLDVMIRANGFRMAGQDAALMAPASQEKQSMTPSANRTDINALNSSLRIVPMQATHEETEDTFQNDDPSSIAATNKKVQEEDAASLVSHKSLHAAGWTMDGESSTIPPATPPKKDASTEKNTLSPINQVSPLMQPISTTTAASLPKSIEEVTSSSEDSGTKLAYLKPLPSKNADSDEKEKARDARILAAKNRAKELRANLNPAAVQELENRKEAKSKALGSPVDSTDSQSSSPLQRKSLKDDPFSKDRFSGRVASVANKFGGGVAAPKSVTPQSTGSSMAPISPSPGNSTFAGRGVSTDHSMIDPEESASRRSTDYSTGDIDSIYPEDAASNFSRDTNPEDEVRSSSIRLGGSIAASSSPLMGPSTDQNRSEEEDRHNPVLPDLRVPYQPGMPLSNLEEESESVLSGSNL